MILVLQHIPCEPLGRIEQHLSEKSLPFRYSRSYENQKAPGNLNEYAGLIVMGGPMGVYEQDQHPFLADEIRLIQSAVREGKPVLGICLGSQLLAAALGASVVKGKRKEIGWHEVRVSDEGRADPVFGGLPTRFMGFHWHGDIFNLPAGAVRLASSDLTDVQAFRYGKSAYGILFHMEVTEPMIRSWTEEFAGEVREERLDARAILDASGRHLPALERAGAQAFGQWAGLAAGALTRR